MYCESLLIVITIEIFFFCFCNIFVLWIPWSIRARGCKLLNVLSILQYLELQSSCELKKNFYANEVYNTKIWSTYNVYIKELNFYLFHSSTTCRGSTKLFSSFRKKLELDYTMAGRCSSTRASAFVTRKRQRCSWNPPNRNPNTRWEDPTDSCYLG